MNPPAAGSPATPTPTGTFAIELDRLTQTLWTWSPARVAAHAAELRCLAESFVHLSHAHGGDVPAEVTLPRLDAHGLADQLAVLGREVTRTPNAERAATAALEHLVATRAALSASEGAQQPS